MPATTPAAFLSGAALCAMWCVVARGWIRFISAEPEFSRAGTLAIVLIFAIFGLGQAGATVIRRSTRGRRTPLAGRVVAVATGRTSLAPRWRAALAILAAVSTLVVLRDLAGDLELWRALVGWALMYAV